MDEFLNKYHKNIIFLLFGLILLGVGVFLFKNGFFNSSNEVEVIDQDEKKEEKDITVEIAGSIEKKGVYKLSSGSRIEDLLVVSGGLSITADRNWVDKNINRAAKLTDGQKVYIPSQSEVISAKESDSIKVDQVVLGASGSSLININNSSQKELESLSGIGPVYAQKIIEQRPYSNIEELVSKSVISQKTFEKIKNSITI